MSSVRNLLCSLLRSGNERQNCGRNSKPVHQRSDQARKSDRERSSVRGCETVSNQCSDKEWSTEKIDVLRNDIYLKLLYWWTC